jgi:hypothetical protein
LSLEQVHACILYYLHNKEAMDAYVTDYIEWGRRMREEQERNPSSAVARLQELRRRQEEQKRLQEQQATEV